MGPPRIDDRVFSLFCLLHSHRADDEVLCVFARTGPVVGLVIAAHPLPVARPKISSRVMDKGP